MGVDLYFKIDVNSIKFISWNRFAIQLEQLIYNHEIKSYWLGKEENEFDVTKEFNAKKNSLEYGYIINVFEIPLEHYDYVPDILLCRANEKYFILTTGEYFYTFEPVEVKDNTFSFTPCRAARMEMWIESLEGNKIKIKDMYTDHDSVYFKKKMNWMSLSKEGREMALEVVLNGFEKCLETCVSGISNMFKSSGGEVTINGEKDLIPPPATLEDNLN